MRCLFSSDQNVDIARRDAPLLEHGVAQALQHKTFFVARNGAAMYQPARRLVNGDQIVVAVQDGKGLGEVVQSEKTRAWQRLGV